MVVIEEVFPGTILNKGCAAFWFLCNSYGQRVLPMLTDRPKEVRNLLQGRFLAPAARSYHPAIMRDRDQFLAWRRKDMPTAPESSR